MGRLDNYNVYLHTYTLRYKQTQEKKSTLRYASLRGVEFFPMGKEERGGAAQGGFLLFILFITNTVKVLLNADWSIRLLPNS